MRSKKIITLVVAGTLACSTLMTNYIVKAQGGSIKANLFSTQVVNKDSSQIEVIKAPFDSVIEDSTTISATIKNSGTLVVKVNGVVKESKAVNAADVLDINVPLENGANEITIGLDGTNLVNYSVLRVSNASIVVDSKYTGVQGAVVDGIARYKKVQDAVNAIQKTNTSAQIIFIKEGSYKEKLVMDKPNVSFVGESTTKTVLTYDDVVGRVVDGVELGTDKTYSVWIKGENFTAENITIQNSFEKDYRDKNNGNPPPSGVERRAVALLVQADKVVFKNCNIIGGQDTLYMKQDRVHFEKCYIEGDVDFIFGAATAFFNKCDIVSVNRETNPKGYLVAPNTIAATEYGFVFNECNIISKDIETAESVFLGRPWAATGSTAYINCYMDSHIKYDGWTTMSGVSPSVARFAEFGSYGPGADAEKITGVRKDKLITAEEAAKYNRDSVLRSWNPDAYMNALYIPIEANVNITDNQTVNAAYYNLVGKLNLDGNLTVKLNGKEVISNKELNANEEFNERLVLEEGVNKIEFVASNIFGITTTKVLNINYVSIAPEIKFEKQLEVKTLENTTDFAISFDKATTITIKLNKENIIENVEKGANQKLDVNLTLKEGINDVEIIAIDADGNRFNKTYNVEYDKQWGEGLFKVSDIALTDILGNTKNNVSGTTFVTVDVSNNSELGKKGFVLIGLYNDKDELVNVSFVEDEFSKDAKIVAASFNVPAGKSYKIKAFVVENLENEKVVSNIVQK